MFRGNGPPDNKPSSAAAKTRAKILTFRRIKIISSFLCMTINNPYSYGEFESLMWIDMLIELLCEPKRCRSTRADIKAWLKNSCFEGLIGQVRQVTEKLRLSLATNGSASPCTSSSAASPDYGAGVPMDLSVSQSSSGIDEDSDSASDVYTPNLYPMDAVPLAMVNVANEELGPLDQANYLDISFPRSEAVFSQGNVDVANQNQGYPVSGAGLAASSYGQQDYGISHGANSGYAMQQEEIWKPSIEDWRTLDGFMQGTGKVRDDHVSEEPIAIAPWLFSEHNLDSMESENDTFVDTNQTLCPVEVKTEVKSDPDSEYLDISYTRSATIGQQAANLERINAPQYETNEEFIRQLFMTVPSPQPNHEGQDGYKYVMDQEEALDYSINKQVPVPLIDIPMMATAPVSSNYVDKSTQTLAVPNDHLARQLNANFSGSSDLLNDCNHVLMGMVENKQHLENLSNGWDVVYRALSLVQATLKAKQQ